MDSTQCQVHSLIADVAIFAEGRVLLVRYRDTNKYDHQPGWFLPDDALSHLEHPDAAARRIAAAQLHLTMPDARLSHVESFRGRNRSWHLVFHYRAGLPAIPAAIGSDDVATFEWFPLGALPSRSDVAHHGWALQILREIQATEERQANAKTTVTAERSR